LVGKGDDGLVGLGTDVGEGGFLVGEGPLGVDVGWGAEVGAGVKVGVGIGVFVGVGVLVGVGVGVLVGVGVDVFVGVGVWLGSGVDVALAMFSSVANGPDRVGVGAPAGPPVGVGVNVGRPGGASGRRFSTSKIIPGFTGARRKTSSGSAL
jgi:hypothetical protein